MNENNLLLLNDLAEQWKVCNRKRAFGGVNAVSGFKYQFDVLLSKICDALDQSRESDIRSEQLSDILHCDAATGVAYVIQVKLTVNRPQLSKALEEFEVVAGFINEKSPEILSSMRFRVATQNIGIKSVNEAVNSWLNKRPSLPRNIRDVLGRIQIVEDPDPTDAVINFLINTLLSSQPYEDLSILRGRLIENANDPGAAVKAVHKKLFAIKKNADITKAPVYWVSQRDIPPDAVLHGDVLTGSRPTFRNLRDGCFTVRSNYHQLYSAFLGFQETVCGTDSKQPVFWIEGRSGTGKSVALLHLLSRLKQTRDLDVMYIKGPSQLDAALRYAMKGTKCGRIVVLGIDDPYRPGESTNEAWDKALSHTAILQQSDDYEKYPILVCCGPTEQRKRLSREFVDQVVVAEWEIPPASKEDINSLREWYVQRTGRLAPDVGDDNILLVQLFFEWRVGESIKEFAKRFGDRLTALNRHAYEIVARVLSANRLYIDYPTKGFHDLALSAEDKDELQVLLDDLHLEPSFSDGELMRIAHPHLSNAIYEIWFPSDGTAKARREEHFRNLLTAYAEADTDPAKQMIPMWSLCNRLHSAVSSSLRKRISDEELHPVLTKAYADLLCDENEWSHVVPKLPAWIELCALCPSLELEPAPVTKAIELLSMSADVCRGMRLVCHKLLQFQDVLGMQVQVRSMLMRLLERFADWHEWPHIATDYIRHNGLDDKFFSLCASWIQAQSQCSRGMAQLLEELLRVSNGSQRVIQAVASSTCMDSRFSSRLVASACKYAPSTSKILLEKWLQENSREHFAARTIGNAISAGFKEVLPIAEEWCSRWHQEYNATWVLERLLELNTNPQVYREWCLSWLSVNGGASASYMIEQLLRIYPKDREIIDVAYNWLEYESPELPHWFPVWLTVSGQEDKYYTTIVQLGTDALVEVSTTHRKWTVVWKRLWLLSNGDPSLVDLVVDKLMTNAALQSNRAWVWIWLMAFNATSADGRITDLGLKWLNTRTTTRRWSMCWTLIADAKGEEEAVIECAIRWLTCNPRTWRVWAAIWLRCVDSKKATQQQYKRLSAAAEEWLVTVPPEEVPAWPMIWQKVVKQNPDVHNLREVALLWLQRRENFVSGDWSQIFRLLWNESSDDLHCLASVWLAEEVNKHGEWPAVWRDVWKETKDDELVGFAVKWLRFRENLNHTSWISIFRDLLNAQIKGVDLFEMGLNWLKVTRSTSNTWGAVWWATARSTRGLPDSLIHLGNKWLLMSKPSSNAWGKIFKRIFDEGQLDLRLNAKLIQFLRDTPRYDQWANLWRMLFNMPDNDEILMLGEAWLLSTAKRYPAHPTWHMVWEDMIANAKENQLTELTNIALDWLDRAPAKITAWPNVWIRLWEMKPSRQLVELGERWTKKGVESNPTYGRLVRVLKTAKNENGSADDF